MDKQKLENLKVKAITLRDRLLRRAKRVALISFAEERKTFKVPVFWALTGIMVIIAIGAVIYENSIMPNRVNYDSYSDTAVYVTDEWIDEVAADKAAEEKRLKENNLQVTAKKDLEASISDKAKQLEMLKFLRDKNVPLLLKEVDNDTYDYVYYIQGYAYRFDNVSFTIGEDDPLGLGLGEGESYQILSDERSGDSVFEANLIFYFVAVLLVVIAFSDEYSTGTIKLVVSRPVSRRDIWAAKMASIATLLTVSWAISALAYVLLSLFFHNPVSYFAEIGGVLKPISVMEFNLLTFVDIFFVSVGFIAVSVFFAVRFKNNVVAVILPFILYFFKSVLIRVVPNLASIDIFENLRLLEHFVLGNAASGTVDAGATVGVAILLTGILSIFAMEKFRRYDMEKIK